MPTAEFPLPSVWNGSFTTSPSVKREAERCGRPLSFGTRQAGDVGLRCARRAGPRAIPHGPQPPTMAGATLLAPWDVIPMAVDARYRDKDGEISRKHDNTSTATATGALKSLSVETSIV
jgi:hypothetical protein